MAPEERQLQASPDKHQDTAGIIIEYKALRDEVLKRIELRQQFVSMTLTIAGVFLGVGATTATVALVYPPLAAFLAIAWMQNDERVKSLAKYIRRHIESSVPGLGWETHVQAERKATRMRSWRFIITSHVGIFLLTQVMAIGVGLLKFTSTSVEWVLLGVDLVAVWVVAWVMRRAVGWAGVRRGEDLMRFAGWYSLVVGSLMLAQWGFFLATGQVPELQTEPFRIAFHLAGEAATAIALIVSGAALLRRLKWARDVSFASLGMLVYTVIVSPGYFAQQGQWPLVAMFAVLLILALVSLRLLAQSEKQ
jgi:hypothetical protein